MINFLREASIKEIYDLWEFFQQGIGGVSDSQTFIMGGMGDLQ